MVDTIDISNLNEKQKTFCEEYLLDLNATQAAKRAGYSEDTAYSQGQRLLKHVEIRAYIQKSMRERSENTLVDAVFVIENLKEVAARCMQAQPVMVFNPIEKQMEQKTDSEGNGVWEFDSNGANKALELMGKHVAMFTDKSDINTNNPASEQILKKIAEKLNA